MNDPLQVDIDRSGTHAFGAGRAYAPSRRGDVRIGPILAIPTVLTELGVAPEVAFRSAGLDLNRFADPDHREPLEVIGRLLDICVELTGCRNFGLLVGERFNLEGLGPIGELMRYSADVDEALHGLLQHLHLHDRGAAPLLLAPEPGRRILGYSIYRAGVHGYAQIYATAIAIGYRILAALGGAGFQPTLVQFSFAQPPDVAEYARVFQSRVVFDAPVSGIVFASSWLSRSLASADRSRHEEIARAIREAERRASTTFAEQVEPVLRAMLMSEPAAGPAVARRFAMHERTLRRRLRAEGLSLRELTNRARFELAGQLLRETRLPVSEISASLQYADSNAFSRAFRAWAKCSPTVWRTQAENHA